MVDQKIILVLDYGVPEDDQHAGGLSSTQYMKMFIDIGYEVIFYPMNRKIVEPYATRLTEYGIELIDPNKYIDLESFLGQNKLNIDFVWINRPEVAKKFINLIKEFLTAKIFYIPHDIAYKRLERMSCFEEINLELIKEKKEEEKKIIDLVDFILFFTNDDLEISKKELNLSESKLKLIPAYFYDQIKNDYSNNIQQKNILFVGNFLHQPNIDGILWFINTSWPKIKLTNPYAKLYVIGRNPSYELLMHSGRDIKIMGFVKDISSYYKKAALTVAPLRYGSGIKGKIIESVFNNVPIVSTSIGLEGTNLIHQENCLKADTEDDLINSCNLLLSNQSTCRILSSNALDYIKNYYSYENGKKLVTELFENLIS